MAHNPLLGNRISLISKKNIRYEGTLYSINEADATVALADVRSYGTEGREKHDPNATYVPPQDAVHPYLLFRGCDIKDLHVHERRSGDTALQPPPPPPDPAIVSTQAPNDIREAAHQSQNMQHPPVTTTNESSSTSAGTDKSVDNKNSSDAVANANQPKAMSRDNDKNGRDASDAAQSDTSSQQNGDKRSSAPHRQHYDGKDEGSRPSNGYKSYTRNDPNSRGVYNRRPRRPDTKVGTGASLLNRKARGAVSGGPNPTPGVDFDFESSLAEFKEKTTIESEDGLEDDSVEASNAYSKDDFFDSISCDVLDKQNGIDNRLRGAAERNLNMDTFGAVSLGNGRRGGRRKGRRGPGGRGYRGGRGRDHRDAGPPPGRDNQRWRRHHSRDKSAQFSSNATAAQFSSSAQYARAAGDR